MELLPERPDGEGAFLILASGGVDSSTLLWMATQQGLKPTALFFDYGQPAAEAECKAVAKICNALNAPWRRIRYSGSHFGVGEIRGRNAFLLHMALLEFPSSSGVVALGIHAGTGYADCSPEFMEVMKRSYEFHTGGEITTVAPFLHWNKQDVYRLAIKLKVPIEHTHSCEISNLPCRKCRSCVDRNQLSAIENTKC